MRTFTGRLSSGLWTVPGLGIGVFIPLGHFVGAIEGPGNAFGPEFQINKSTGSGRCQVCVGLDDNNPFFGTPNGTGNPLMNLVCKPMSDA